MRFATETTVLRPRRLAAPTRYFVDRCDPLAPLAIVTRAFADRCDPLALLAGGDGGGELSGTSRAVVVTVVVATEVTVVVVDTVVGPPLGLENRTARGLLCEGRVDSNDGSVGTVLGALVTRREASPSASTGGGRALVTREGVAVGRLWALNEFRSDSPTRLRKLRELRRLLEARSCSWASRRCFSSG